MCTGKCSRFVAIALYPLVVISIICNIVLLFPDGDVKYVQSDLITEQVKYMGGVVGGGILVSCDHPKSYCLQIEELSLQAVPLTGSIL